MTDRVPAAGFDPAAAGWSRQEANTFLGSITTVWRRDLDGSPSLGIFCEKQHDNGWGNLHGGILMTLADVGLGAVVGRLRNRDRQPGEAPVRSPTIQLDVSFIGAVRMGEFVYTRAEALRLTRSLTFMRGTLLVGDAVVASAQGVFKAMSPAGAG